MILVSKLNMAASDEVNVVLNQSNTHSEIMQQSQTGQLRPNGGVGGGKKEEIVKFANTPVNRGSKNVSLRHLFI